MGTPKIQNSGSGLISDDLIFVANGIVYAGHYHSNGWFYNDCKRSDVDLFMARGPSARSINVHDFPSYSVVTEWHYLN